MMGGLCSISRDIILGLDSRGKITLSMPICFVRSYFDDGIGEALHA